MVGTVPAVVPATVTTTYPGGTAVVATTASAGSGATTYSNTRHKTKNDEENGDKVPRVTSNLEDKETIRRSSSCHASINESKASLDTVPYHENTIEGSTNENAKTSCKLPHDSKDDKETSKNTCRKEMTRTCCTD